MFCDADLMKFGFDRWNLVPRTSIYMIIRLLGPNIYEKQTKMNQKLPNNRQADVYYCSDFGFALLVNWERRAGTLGSDAAGSQKTSKNINTL